MGDPFDKAAEAFQPEPKKAAAHGPMEADGVTPARPRLEIDAEGEFDMAEEDYHADPCPEPSASSSFLKVLLRRSPVHARETHPRLNPDWEPTVSDTFDAGSVFHKLILGKGPEIAVLPYKDFKTDAAKKAKAEARERGHLPVLEANMPKVEAMVRAVRAQVPGWEELAYAMQDGSPERVLLWREETVAGPVWCRAMLDWRPKYGNLVPDWKSAQQGAGPNEWGARTCWDLDAEIQDAFYRRGIRKVLGLPDPALLFAVAEMKAPHALAVHRMTPATHGVADRKVQYALDMFGLCLRSGKWPGYRRETAWLESPPWKDRDWLEREERGETAAASAWAIYEALEAADVKGLARPAEVNDEDPFGLPPLDKDSTHDA